MSFIRYMLADWRIAFVPQIGAEYRYASNGPFEIGPRFTPKALSRGYVLYEIKFENEFVSEMAASYGVFASLYRPV
ncbi:hypothetical protein HH212_00120 [Massilia forsythiae]|uniref:Uncharacterized protein n=1 Tax=Massilia forsythiae TaxID=2728020 RepID=A0A7Z2VSI3_9BURK|nr:hypothetical protein [Massilia forsythiae]QJD98642.1 hypothetical protein HH212_00120 [Massilia forsythiae]